MDRTDPTRKQYQTTRTRYRLQAYHRWRRTVLSNRDSGMRKLRRTSSIRQPDGPSISEASPSVNNNYAGSFSRHGITRWNAQPNTGFNIPYRSGTCLMRTNETSDWLDNKTLSERSRTSQFQYGTSFLSGTFIRPYWIKRWRQLNAIPCRPSTLHSLSRGTQFWGSSFICFSSSFVYPRSY